MHPAASVIFFTVMSGAGFGLLAMLGLGLPDVTGMTAFALFFVAYALAVGGLLASTFHLGKPQRALRAFSQWKSSWLSREGWLSVLALLVMSLYALGPIFMETRVAVIGILGAALSLGTVFTTSMIYTQLKTVPRWNHWLTPALFLSLSLAGGTLLAGQVSAATLFLMIAGGVQIAHWLLGDKRFEQRGHSLGTATGLGRAGKVRSFSPPHTGSNYLLREMVHVVGRKHAQKLRVVTMVFGFIAPVVLLLLPFNHVFALLAVVSHLVGLLVSRWLFFAEAEHVVGLYYGKR